MEVVRSLCSSSHEKFRMAGCGVGVSAVAFKLFHVVLAVFFAIVGITIGAISGASLGLKSRGGILHGSMVGAIIGSVVSTSILGSFISTWDSDSDDTSCAWFLPWIDSTAILTAKLVHDYYMGMSDHVRRGRQAKNLADEGRINPTDENLVDPSGNRLCCSICLQKMELAGVTRMLPQCRHAFHAECIERWLSYKRSCPLCRSLVS